MRKDWLSLSFSLLLFIPLNICALQDRLEWVPQLSVKGEATVLKPADQVEITLGVMTVGDTSTLALNENNKRMHQVEANLLALGLQPNELKTDQFHVQPIYRNPPKDHEQKDQKDQSVISHYEVKNALHIKTPRLDLMSKIIEAATAGGANQVDQVNFSLENPQGYRAEAIALATENAMADARDLAKAAHVRLVRVLDISLDAWKNEPRYGSYSYAMAKTDRGNDTPLQPGNIDIHTTVQMTFEIAPEKS